MTTLKEPRVLSAESLMGTEITNSDGDDLGQIEDIMIDLAEGEIAYAVVKFGGWLGMGEKLFAIPWNAIRLSLHDEKALLQVPKEQLEDAEGFDKDDWPNMADRAWAERIHKHFGYEPYWQDHRTQP